MCFFTNLKSPVVLVRVILVDVVGESPDNEEPAVMAGDAARTVEDFWRLVLRQEGEIAGIVNVHPGISVALGVVELTEVHCDVDFSWSKQRSP